MNTFFIPPLIPFKIFLSIKEEKEDLNLNENEKIIVNNLDFLYDYNTILTQDQQDNIESIINKYDSKNNTDLSDKLFFIDQDSYSEITIYNHIIYKLLIERNYIQIINHESVKSITTTFGLSDIGPLSDKPFEFNKLNELDKYNYIESFINFSNKKNTIHDIMAKSQITSKINTLTRILSNKSILYNLLNNEDFIPISVDFNILNEDHSLNNIIEKFKNNNKSEYFVIKPSTGTLSDGLAIRKISELNIDFIKNWTTQSDNNIHSPSGQYTTWILSSFIQSFLWKLNGPSNTSKVFKKKSIPELKDHSFNDTIGRINKFRFWCLWTVIDGEFVSYLYKNGYSELSLEELTTYSKTQLDPSDIEEYYKQLLNVEEDKNEFKNIQQNKSQNPKLEAATVGTYLDFARVVNENNYPLGKDAWNDKVMPEMYRIVNTIHDKCKRHIGCINKNSKDKSGCYSYFALDILIDDNNKPWLLEANSKPFVGFSNWWNKYDERNEHCVNVSEFLNNVLSLTVDTINDSNGVKNTQEDFLVTMDYELIKKKNVYIPFTLGLSDTSTSKIYNKIYDILDLNNYSSFPYAKYTNSAVGFKGISPISKYLISQIGKLGKNHVITLLRHLYPQDARQKMLNKIASLSFYLGNKAELTVKIKENNDDWDSIIPWSIIFNKGESLIKLNSLLKSKKFNLICKPSSGQQGKDILITNSIENIFNHINNLNYDSWIVSRYLDNPFLIKLNKTGVSGIEYSDSKGRKSHLRTYVLLHKKQGELNAYLYKKSLIFCAAKEYHKCETDKEYCNLTNLYYGSKYYKELGKDPNDAYKDLSGITNTLIDNKTYSHLMKQVKIITQKTILSVKKDLVCLNYNNECFQYIALDFHLENENENEIRPWLLEVNSTPGLLAPDYQFKINNYLENILNLTLNTTISKGNKQMFEFISFRKNYKDSQIINELEKPFTVNECVSNYTYLELKQLLLEKNIPGRSKLTTKKQMCKKLS